MRRLVTILTWAAVTVVPASAASAAPYVRGEVLVRQHGQALPRVVHLPAGESVTSAAAALRHDPGVATAVPNYLAHIARAPRPFYPDDMGRTQDAGGWKKLQWNFLQHAGVNAPQAWANLIRDGHPGGRGVTVAVLDTGVAYRNTGKFRRSPDFRNTRFAPGYDFVDHDRIPIDRNGHGTHVAGTIAEGTNNRVGVTGLAYGATIMPVRVLDRDGYGETATIARGIRWAADHHAQVINMSFEFPRVSAGDVPDLSAAVRYAVNRGAVVVAAAGNDRATSVAYPAAAGGAIAVGATTIDRCRSDYSNTGTRLDLVAPGGGEDAYAPGQASCRPDFDRNWPAIFQMTFTDSVQHFGLPDGYDGTSMATAHVSGVAALVIASGVIGRHPSPARVLARLKATAHDLGPNGPDAQYGAGLVDAGAATD